MCRLEETTDAVRPVRASNFWAIVVRVSVETSTSTLYLVTWPVVVTITLIGALVVLLTNLATDIAYTRLDPRIRYD